MPHALASLPSWQTPHPGADSKPVTPEPGYMDLIDSLDPFYVATPHAPVTQLTEDPRAPQQVQRCQDQDGWKGPWVFSPTCHRQTPPERLTQTHGISSPQQTWRASHAFNVCRSFWVSEGCFNLPQIKFCSELTPVSLVVLQGLFFQHGFPWCL